MLNKSKSSGGFNRFILIRIIASVLFPAALALAAFAESRPWLVNQYYSGALYPVIARILRLGSSFLNFSLAEAVIVLVPVLLVLLICKKAVNFIRRKINLKKLLAEIAVLIVNILCCLSFLYFLFIILWGINYYKPPLRDIAGFDTFDISVYELGEICGYLAGNLNELSGAAGADLTAVSGGWLPDSEEGFKNIRESYGGFIKFIPSRAKPVFFHGALSYLGISGIYIPHTAEPNVNSGIPACSIPSTVCHEQAHQLGFAREDEANFISFLACVNSPDARFRYSGFMLAFIHSSNALFLADYERYSETVNSLSPEVLADIKEIRDYWRRYEGRASEISDRLNDNYLRINGQDAGVKSYGAMVDLVAGYLRGK